MAVSLKDATGWYYQNGNNPVLAYMKKFADNVQGTWATDSLGYFFITYLREFAIMATGKIMVSEKA